MTRWAWVALAVWCGLIVVAGYVLGRYAGPLAVGEHLAVLRALGG